MAHRQLDPRFNFLTEIALPIKIAIIAVSVLAIFFQDFVVLGSDALSSEYFNYVLIIPFISLYFVYRKRKMLAAVAPLQEDSGRGFLNQAIGASALFVSLILYLLGTYISFPLEYHLIALEIFIGGAVLLLFNLRTLRILALPILLITTALPSLIGFGLSIWLWLSYASGYASYLIDHAAGLAVSFTTVADVPSLIVTTKTGESISFVIGVASSGVYSFVGFALFAFVVVYIAKGSVLRRALLFALGFPLLLLINILRITVIVGAAYFWGDTVSTIFHLTSGLVLVTVLAIALLVVGERFFKLRYFEPAREKEKCDSCAREKSSGNSFCTNCGRFLRSVGRTLNRRELASIALISLVVMIFLSSLAPAVAMANTPSSANLSALTPQGAIAFLPNIPGWKLTYDGHDQYVEQVLSENAALLYTYTPVNKVGNFSTQGISVAVLVGPTFHSPEDSLIRYPSLFGRPGATVFVDKDEEILSSPPLIGRYFVYQRPSLNFTEALLYWNTRALFNFGSYSGHQNVQIQIWSYAYNLVELGMIRNASDYQSALQAYLPVATHIANYWASQEPISVIQAGIKRSYGLLFVLAAVPGVAVTSVALAERRKDTRARMTLAGRIESTSDRYLLEALSHSADDGIPTLENVLAKYKTLTNASLSSSEVLSALTYAELADLVRREIVEIDGEPRMVWKNIVRLGKKEKTLRFV